MHPTPAATDDAVGSPEGSPRRQALDLGLDPLAVQELVYESVERLTLDERPAEDFFDVPRIGVAHTDEAFTRRLTALYRRLLAPLSGPSSSSGSGSGPSSSAVLDLCSSSASHLPPDLGLGQVVGHGVNAAELEANSALTSRFVQDLNRRTVLPLGPASVGAVLCCNGIQYLTRPEWVAAEVRRVLRPGGLAVVAFSSHCWAERAAAGWLARSAEQRLELVRRLLEGAGLQVVEVVRDHVEEWGREGDQGSQGTAAADAAAADAAAVPPAEPLANGDLYPPASHGATHPTAPSSSSSSGGAGGSGGGSDRDAGAAAGITGVPAASAAAAGAAGGGDPLFAVVARRPLEGGVLVVGAGWEGAGGGVLQPEPSPTEVASTLVGPGLRELDLGWPAGAARVTPLMLERWRESYGALVEDAAVLGIPRSAIPALPADASAEQIRAARDHLQAMIESFLSAGL